MAAIAIADILKQVLPRAMLASVISTLMGEGGAVFGERKKKYPNAATRFAKTTNPTMTKPFFIVFPPGMIA